VYLAAVWGFVRVTVVPGITAPEASVTTPVTEDCCWAWSKAAGAKKRNRQASVASKRFIGEEVSWNSAAPGAGEGCRKAASLGALIRRSGGFVCNQLAKR
jgi:hypothetical protein